MDEQIAQQLGLGALALVVGLSGWILPYRWNLLRLRRGLDGLLSEGAREAVPKIIGTILAVVGIAILIGTAVVGKFK
jgi:hypothetical protein